MKDLESFIDNLGNSLWTPIDNWLSTLFLLLHEKKFVRKSQILECSNKNGAIKKVIH